MQLKRSKKKNTRLTKLAKLAKLVPSEPSATSARWDPNCSPDDFMQRALAAIDQTRVRLSTFEKMGIRPETETYNVKEAERLFYEARYQLLGPKYGLAELLDRSNWVSERPSVSLRATINRRAISHWYGCHPAPHSFLDLTEH